MRLGHFEQLKPVCPRCLKLHQESHPLRIAGVFSEAGGHIIEAILHCTNTGCQQEYPVVDGIPIIVPNVREFVTNQAGQILRRADLGKDIRSLLGDAIGPTSEFDQSRQHLNIYCWDHYAEFDPEEAAGELRPGSIVRVLDSGMDLLGEIKAPAIDLGCSVGRTTFELARRTGGITVGVDLNFAMLQASQRVLRTGRLRYDRRRVGLVYDERDFPVAVPAADQVDFWACDVLALPFSDGQFGSAVGLNILDCVSAPADLLGTIRRILRNGGGALLATPFDWSPAATPVEAWIGGHSQRGAGEGRPEPGLEGLIAGQGGGGRSLSIGAVSPGIAWQTRLHDRSSVRYELHLVALQASG